MVTDDSNLPLSSSERSSSLTPTVSEPDDHIGRLRNVQVPNETHPHAAREPEIAMGDLSLEPPKTPQKEVSASHHQHTKIMTGEYTHLASCVDTGKLTRRYTSPGQV